VAELRSRIDRYAPEWSDHNDNDPGIALLQLFAWLAEIQLFRMGQVPELNYLKFLELVGIELTPARPAAAAVTFPVDSAHAAPTVTVPALTQIAAEGAEGPILFELERALTAVRAPLAAVQSFDGFVFQDLTGTDEAAETGYYPLGRAFGPEAALYLGFAETLPDASLTLTAWAAGAERGSAVVACHEAARFETSRLAWEVWDGREWRGLTLLADGTAALTRTGSVSLRGPKAGLSVARTLGRIDTSLHWLRARATKVAYQAPPRLLALRTNTGAVVQAETLEFESLGGSNGETHQVVRLADAPVLAGSAVIEVDEGQGFLPWT
jgi:predicted phage baseplate assembly protein